MKRKLLLIASVFGLMICAGGALAISLSPWFDPNSRLYRTEMFGPLYSLRILLFVGIGIFAVLITLSAISLAVGRAKTRASNE